MNDQAKVPMNMDSGRAHSPRPRPEAIAQLPVARRPRRARRAAAQAPTATIATRITPSAAAAPWLSPEDLTKKTAEESVASSGRGTRSRVAETSDAALAK